MDKVLLSTGKDDWGTPQKLYDALNKEFGFTMDACADDTNYKCMIVIFRGSSTTKTNVEAYIQEKELR